ncbi:MAG: hypothetical protein M0030_18005 [Actinomycetota bacterium]|nr:hypothetical protein [Actinomycetota bacterium]
MPAEMVAVAFGGRGPADRPADRDWHVASVMATGPHRPGGR